mmetsp:Transcript_29971/g.74889  ORF Transcript_29971/g.74889 Transcript_29971/m.74889 type:complete len:85 (+) Transcript_29971:307-561(+)
MPEVPRISFCFPMLLHFRVDDINHHLATGAPIPLATGAPFNPFVPEHVIMLVETCYFAISFLHMKWPIVSLHHDIGPWLRASLY